MTEVQLPLNIQLQLYIVQIKVQALSNNDTKNVYQQTILWLHQVIPGY